MMLHQPPRKKNLILMITNQNQRPKRYLLENINALWIVRTAKLIRKLEVAPFAKWT